MIRTIKTKQFKITAFVLALVLTVSCVLWNTTEVHAQELTIDNTSMQTFAGARATTNAELVGSQENPATMSVFITGGTSDRYKATNVKWTNEGSYWKGERAMLFEGVGSQQQIYACAPYTENVTNGVYLPVTAGDPTDWLVATSTELETSNVSLTMTHALTKLVIIPQTFGTEVTNKAITKIEVGGMYASGDLNISDNTWSNLSEEKTTLEVNDNYELLAIPTDCESFTVTVTMEDGRVFTTTVTCPKGGLAAGTQYNITLQVGQDVVNIGGITASSWISVDGGALKTE